MRIAKPIKRTKSPKRAILRQAVANPFLLIREINNRSFYEFFRFFWPEVSSETLKDNWHIKVLCDILQEAAERVGQGLPKIEDIIINIPPGSTKTIICSIMFPAWCWTRWFWMKFITVSYSASLSLESAEYSRDLIKSDRFQAIYPELHIKQDKDKKSNFRIVKKIQVSAGRQARTEYGGNRYSTSVKGTLTGFHGHIIIWDDPLNPQQAQSDVELKSINHWMSQTLTTRKVDKAVTVTIGVMQRLHQNDTTGYTLAKKDKQIKHICLPGEITSYRKQVQPPKLAEFYINDLLDPVRLPKKVLEELEADLGQYGYAGQIGQNPTPPSGGMFKVDQIQIIEQFPGYDNIIKTVRYWDKAGTGVAELKKGRKAAFTAGVKMHLLKNGKYLISNVTKGQWESHVREDKIKQTAESDELQRKKNSEDPPVEIWIEQEPGSGGKESAENTIKNLAGYVIDKETPKGDKAYRADPFSVQVNNGNVMVLQGEWTTDYIEELRFFPFSTYKDQVDGSSGAFSKLTTKKTAGGW